jgi:hypothetical protein
MSLAVLFIADIEADAQGDRRLVSTYEVPRLCFKNRQFAPARKIAPVDRFRRVS